MNDLTSPKSLKKFVFVTFFISYPHPLKKGWFNNCVAVALQLGSHFNICFIRSIASGEAPITILDKSVPELCGNFIPILFAWLTPSNQVLLVGVPKVVQILVKTSFSVWP